MCGPLLLAATRDQRGFWSYQIGRATSYTLLFSLAYSLKAALGTLTEALEPGWLLGLDLALGLSISLVLALRALELLGFNLSVPKLSPPNLSRSKFRFPKGATGFVMGIGSAFLPCAVLYAAALVAAQNRSILLAAASGLLFATATTPALISLWVGRHKLSHLFSSSPAKRVTALLLIMLAGWIATVRLSHYRGQQHGVDRPSLLCL